MAVGESVELVGANKERVAVVGKRIETRVSLDNAVRQKVAANRSIGAVEGAEDRVFLNLENVNGLADTATFQVYLNVPQDSDPTSHPELLAGSVALFGVSQASDENGEHGGQGLNFVLDVTDIVDRLHLDNQLDSNELKVEFVPYRPVRAEAQVSIGRVSLFRAEIPPA